MNDTGRKLQAGAAGGRVTPIVRAAESVGEPLRVCVERGIEAYFRRLDGEVPKDLYAMVLAEVEAPLLESVLRQAQGNQSLAAAMLGINRGTLRKKLKQYDLLG